MTSLIKPLLLLGLAANCVVSTQVWGGNHDLEYDSNCGVTQEFSSVNDICDPCAGAATNGRCRNGDNSGGTCPALTNCGQPTVGHAIENTICAPGRHIMAPGKRFRCVRATNYTVPAIVYENRDCTGKACFIPGNGAFDVRFVAHCVDINPAAEVNAVPCEGEKGESTGGEAGGGFPFGIPVLVGGPVGLPPAPPPPPPQPSKEELEEKKKKEDEEKCKRLDDFNTDVARVADTVTLAAPGSIVDDGPDDWDEKTDEGGRFPKRRRRLETRDRADPNGLGKSLRNAYKYAPSYRNPDENTEISWYYMDDTNPVLIKKIGDKPEPQDKFGVDHVVELDTIIRFAIDDARKPGSVAKEQWDLLKEFLARPHSCQSFKDFAQVCGAPPATRGVWGRLDSLKNLVFTQYLTGSGGPVLTKWTQRETFGTLEYLKAVEAQALVSAQRIGAALDVVAGTSTGDGGPITNDFTTLIRNQWADGKRQLEEGLAANVFKPQP
ncbi:MAG: hypothetical protein M1817_002493 [Caeruleum heppii]|nr:MAG: hypothetical protein M1817_002493 [Caeruleum heppii]